MHVLYLGNPKRHGHNVRLQDGHDKLFLLQKVLQEWSDHETKAEQKGNKAEQIAI